jgi:hypothetical protein
MSGKNREFWNTFRLWHPAVIGIIWALILMPLMWAVAEGPEWSVTSLRFVRFLLVSTMALVIATYGIFGVLYYRHVKRSR